MARNERDTDRDDTAKDDEARPSLAYDPAVLAAKLAAAREQRRRVLAARAAAEGEPTPEARRAKLAPFARRPGEIWPPSSTGHVGASAGPPVGAEPAPQERTVGSVGEDAAPTRHEPGAPAPETPTPEREAATLVPEPRAAAAVSDGKPGPRTRAVPAAGADRAAARGATAEIETAPGGREPRRRRPVGRLELGSPAPERSAQPRRSSTLLARLVPLGVLAVGWVLASLVFFAPSTVRQRIADVIAPEPAPSVATSPSGAQMPPPPAAGEHAVDPRPAIGVELAAPAVERGAPSAPGSPRGAPDAVETAAAPPREAGDPSESIRPRADEVHTEPAKIATGAVAPPARNAPTEATAAADTPTTAAAPSPPEPVPDLEAAAVTSRLVLHFPASAAADARRVEATLRSAGVEEVTLVPAAFAVSRANVRYYRPEYRALGHAVADIAERRLDGGPVEVRDFTAFRPQPSPGTLELWLAGTDEAPAPDLPASAAAAPAESGPASAPAAPEVVPRAGRARVAERERLEDEVTRLLRARLRDLQPE